MPSRLALTALVLALGLSACAASDDVLGPDRLQVTGLEIVADPKVDVRYPALLTIEAEGNVRIVDSCFIWLDSEASLSWFGNGPYCFAPEDSPARAVRALLVTGYAGTYQVEGYVRYASGGVLRHSNSATTEVTVTHRH